MSIHSFLKQWGSENQNFGTWVFDSVDLMVVIKITGIEQKCVN